MSTRIPSLIDGPHVDAPVKKEMPFPTTDWTEWKFLKSRHRRCGVGRNDLGFYPGARLCVVALGISVNGFVRIARGR